MGLSQELMSGGLKQRGAMTTSHIRVYEEIDNQSVFHSFLTVKKTVCPLTAPVKLHQSCAGLRYGLIRLRCESSSFVLMRILLHRAHEFRCR